MKLVGFLIMLSFMLLIAIGWVKNIMILLGMETLQATGEVVLRIIGIFLAPIGSIMGWFF